MKEQKDICACSFDAEPQLLIYELQLAILAR